MNIFFVGLAWIRKYVFLLRFSPSYRSPIFSILRCFLSTLSHLEFVFRKRGRMSTNHSWRCNKSPTLTRVKNNSLRVCMYVCMEKVACLVCLDRLYIYRWSTFASLHSRVKLRICEIVFSFHGNGGRGTDANQLWGSSSAGETSKKEIIWKKIY